MSATTVLIRVLTHDYNGNKYHAPEWFLLGTQDAYEDQYRWDTGEDLALVLGEQQDAGHYILDVADLGLDPKVCLQQMWDLEEIVRLHQEEDNFSLHTGDGPCLCGDIARISQRRKSVTATITKAVCGRYDTWTRRSHLVALADSTGMLAPSNYPALNEMVPEPVECESPKIPSRPVATTACEWLMAP